MPSKGKKKPSPTSDRSPLPRTPSTPKPGSVSAPESEIALLRNLLASRFPTLITDNSLVGRISEKDPDLTKGNQESRVWLSESAMLSSSLAPASLVSISLAASVNNVANDPAGCYFAIATVFPSRKVIKEGVRLSWALSRTLGSQAIGRAVFISPIGNDNRKCTDIYLALVPPTDGNSRESVGIPAVNETMTLSPKTPASRSRLSSPCATPRSGSREPSLDSDVSAVRLALADEKARELLQASAARWLYGRHLLVGNHVAIPLVFGQICVFRVEGAEKGNQDLVRDVNSCDRVNVVHVVDARTKVHLSDPLSSVGENPSRERTKKEDTLHMEGRDKEGGDMPRLGGLSKEFDALKEIIMFSLANKDNMPRYKGVLLHGPPGTGKTSLASYCARDAGASLFFINGPEIVSQYFGESEQALHEVFESAKRAAPAVIFIDELDAIAPTRKDGGEELSLRMVATLLKLMDEINRSDGILVIAATNRPDSIDPAMRRPGRLDREIEIGVPSPEQRLHILSTLLSRMDHSIGAMELQSLASATHGFVGADLAALCNEAAMIALRRHIKLTSFKDGSDADLQSYKLHTSTNPRSGDHMSSLLLSLSELTVSTRSICPINHQKATERGDTSQDVLNRTNKQEEMLLEVTIEDFEKAKMKVRPSAMREVMLELPKVRWEDVGGQNKVKQQLIEAVQWPQMCPEAFERIGIRPPRGLLLIGPPGCSKTLLARAVASEAKLNFLAVKGPELFSKWVGESEKAIRSLFAKARANSPAIIFFDEIDGLAITRGEENDGTSVADRVLSQLLVEMDGLDRRAAITVIAATNRPDKIDPALLRPGRFDRLLDVQPPDKTDREAIFHIHVRNMPCSPDVSIKDLASLTEGYTGADIKLICREAAVAALEESLEIKEVSMKHFKIGIARVHPSDVQFYKELASQFRRIVDSGAS